MTTHSHSVGQESLGPKFHTAARPHKLDHLETRKICPGTTSANRSSNIWSLAVTKGLTDDEEENNSANRADLRQTNKEKKSFVQEAPLGQNWRRLGPVQLSQATTIQHTQYKKPQATVMNSADRWIRGSIQQSDEEDEEMNLQHPAAASDHYLLVDSQPAQPQRRARLSRGGNESEDEQTVSWRAGAGGAVFLHARISTSNQQKAPGRHHNELEESDEERSSTMPIQEPARFRTVNGTKKRAVSSLAPAIAQSDPKFSAEFMAVQIIQCALRTHWARQKALRLLTSRIKGGAEVLAACMRMSAPRNRFRFISIASAVLQARIRFLLEYRVYSRQLAAVALVGRVAAHRISAAVRRKLVRRAFSQSNLSRICAGHLLAAFSRRHFHRCQLIDLRDAVLDLQRTIRGAKFRNRFTMLSDATKLLQNGLRRQRCQQVVLYARREEQCAAEAAAFEVEAREKEIQLAKQRIQTLLLRFFCQTAFLRSKVGILWITARVRTAFAANLHSQIVLAAKNLQARMRATFDLRAARRLRRSSALLCVRLRSSLLRKSWIVLRSNITLLQGMVRCQLLRENHTASILAALVLQNAVRVALRHQLAIADITRRLAEAEDHRLQRQYACATLLRFLEAAVSRGRVPNGLVSASGGYLAARRELLIVQAAVRREIANSAHCECRVSALLISRSARSALACADARRVFCRLRESQLREQEEERDRTSARNMISRRVGSLRFRRDFLEVSFGTRNLQKVVRAVLQRRAFCRNCNADRLVRVVAAGKLWAGLCAAIGRRAYLRCIEESEVSLRCQRASEKLGAQIVAILRRQEFLKRCQELAEEARRCSAAKELTLRAAAAVAQRTFSRQCEEAREESHRRAAAKLLVQRTSVAVHRNVFARELKLLAEIARHQDAGNVLARWSLAALSRLAYLQHKKNVADTICQRFAAQRLISACLSSLTRRRFQKVYCARALSTILFARNCRRQHCIFICAAVDLSRYIRGSVLRLVHVRNLVNIKQFNSASVIHACCCRQSAQKRQVAQCVASMQLTAVIRGRLAATVYIHKFAARRLCLQAQMACRRSAYTVALARHRRVEKLQTLLRHSAIAVIQARVRARQSSAHQIVKLAAASTLVRFARVAVARADLQLMVEQLLAAVSLQAICRRLAAVVLIRRLRSSCSVLKRSASRAFHRRNFGRTVMAAISLLAAARSSLARKALHQSQNEQFEANRAIAAASLVFATVLRSIASAVFKQRRLAANHLQACARALVKRKNHTQAKLAALHLCMVSIRACCRRRHTIQIAAANLLTCKMASSVHRAAWQAKSRAYCVLIAACRSSGPRTRHALIRAGQGTLNRVLYARCVLWRHDSMYISAKCIQAFCRRLLAKESRQRFQNSLEREICAGLAIVASCRCLIGRSQFGRLLKARSLLGASSHRYFARRKLQCFWTASCQLQVRMHASILRRKWCKRLNAIRLLKCTILSRANQGAWRPLSNAGKRLCCFLMSVLPRKNFLSSVLAAVTVQSAFRRQLALNFVQRQRQIDAIHAVGGLLVRRCFHQRIRKLKLMVIDILQRSKASLIRCQYNRSRSATRVLQTAVRGRSVRRLYISSLVATSRLVSNVMRAARMRAWLLQQASGSLLSAAAFRARRLHAHLYYLGASKYLVNVIRRNIARNELGSRLAAGIILNAFLRRAVLSKAPRPFCACSQLSKILGQHCWTRHRLCCTAALILTATIRRTLAFKERMALEEEASEIQLSVARLHFFLKAYIARSNFLQLIAGKKISSCLMARIQRRVHENNYAAVQRIQAACRCTRNRVQLEGRRRASKTLILFISAYLSRHRWNELQRYERQAAEHRQQILDAACALQARFRSCLVIHHCDVRNVACLLQSTCRAVILSRMHKLAVLNAARLQAVVRGSLVRMDFLLLVFATRWIESKLFASFIRLCHGLQAKRSAARLLQANIRRELEGMRGLRNVAGQALEDFFRRRIAQDYFRAAVAIRNSAATVLQARLLRRRPRQGFLRVLAKRQFANVIDRQRSRRMWANTLISGRKLSSACIRSVYQKDFGTKKTSAILLQAALRRRLAQDWLAKSLDEKARRKAERRAKRDAEERERLDAAERERKEGEERARRETAEKETREAEEREQREADARQKEEDRARRQRQQGQQREPAAPFDPRHLAAEHAFRLARFAKYKELESALERAGGNGHFDVDVRNPEAEGRGETLLMVSAGQGNKRVAKLLLRMGADKNAVDARGDTVLHHAARWNYDELASYLVEKGCDPSIRNARGETYLEVQKR